MKDYLTVETDRNKVHAALYSRLLRKAFGHDTEVLVGHHFCFQDPVPGIGSENEIPSADTVIFDHEIMTACFGDDAVRVMQELAAVPCESRDMVLQELVDGRSL
jgi:hypothetical protein